MLSTFTISLRNCFLEFCIRNSSHLIRAGNISEGVRIQRWYYSTIRQDSPTAENLLGLTIEKHFIAYKPALGKKIVWVNFALFASNIKKNIELLLKNTDLIEIWIFEKGQFGNTKNESADKYAGKFWHSKKRHLRLQGYKAISFLWRKGRENISLTRKQKYNCF